MPELPEVETVVRDLRPLVAGRTVTAVRVGAKRLRTPWDAAWNARLVGARVDAVGRRGKWIVLELSQEPLPPTPSPGKGRGAGSKPPPFPGEGVGGEVSSGARLLVHLGMTGQFTASPAADPPPDHLHLVFALDDRTELRFRDVRRFGSARYFADAAGLDAHFAAAKLGPEPFGLDAAYFRDAVRRTARPLKAVLLDQTVVAGVGNIYADEALFRAGLHPGLKGNRVPPAAVDRLREAVEAVLTAAVAGRGSTIRDYVGGSGLRGGYQHAHAVYGRTGEPCPACGSPIECVRLAGRSSHFCGGCQPSVFSRQPGKTKPRAAGISKRRARGPRAES